MTPTATPVMAPPEPTTVSGLAGRLFNLSNRRRREWVPIAVPYLYGRKLHTESTFVTDRGLMLRAVKCEDVGTHSTIFRVFAPFDPKQSIAGKLTTLGSERDIPFHHHPWSFDDPYALIPKVAIRINGQDQWCRNFQVLEIEAGEGAKNGSVRHPCFQRWHFRGVAGTSGFIVEGWVTFYAGSPIADIRVAIVWSDRRDPNQSKWIQGILFETGEITKFDFGLRNGMLEIPVFNGTGWVNAVLGDGGPDGKSLGFIDGSGIPLTGRMLCAPQGGPTAAMKSDADPDRPYSDSEMWQDVETLFAAGEAPVYGVAERSVWDGKWLAHGNIARIRQLSGQLQSNFDGTYAGFTESLGTWSGMYGDRPIGVSNQPGRTGDQEDFGSTKGWPAVHLGDARWMHYAMYSVVADYFRGFMHYEADGTRLDPTAHPNWVTWSGYTHWHHGQSSDRLGKNDDYRTATRYEGYDDQHRSQNNLAACYALTGDPLLKFIIEHISTSDIANVRFRNDFGIGATRAVGRTALCWSNFYRLTDVGSEANTRYKTLLTDLASRTERFFIGNNFAGPVNAFDAFTDPRMGLTWEGQPIRGWVVWEHGLFLQGTYAAWKVTGDEQWLDLTRKVSKTIVLYGCFKSADDNLWWMCNHVHWSDPNAAPLRLPEGEPIPEQWYTKGSTLVTHDRGGVATWTFPAFLMFMETADANDPAIGKARAVIEDWTDNAESVDPRTAEWWACCKNVVPQPGDHLRYELNALRPERAIA